MAVPGIAGWPLHDSRKPAGGPSFSGGEVPSIGSNARLASVACPSLGETGSSSMTIVADFRAGKGTGGGAYSRDD
jgi:hypothetical protein